MADRPAAYPTSFEAEIELSDGGTAFLRPVLPTDADSFRAFHERQSAESIYYRFFSPHPRLSDDEVERFVTVDYADRMALVAVLGDVVIGIARYDRPEASRSAEVAFFIDDEHHGRGLATIMLEHLAEAARARGLVGFWATVLPDNRRMVSVFRQAGFGVSSRFADGVIEVELSLTPTEEARAAIDERARVAQQEAVRRLLEPASVAVIGAGTQHDGLGRRVLDAILDHRFTGRVVPVHPNASSISGVDAVESVLDIDEQVDLAIVAVPAPAVIEVVDECGRAGVSAVIVLAAGFADAGQQGAELEKQLLTVVRRHGMRLLGPNGLGLVNTDPAAPLWATFVAAEPIAGDVAIMSQSGTMGGAILDQATRVGLGVSSFVSVGNKADVSGNDLLSFWATDDRTNIVLLYLESFGNPRRFARIARHVSLTKPVLAIKAGRVGSVGDLDDSTVDALLARHGVIRVDGVTRLLDVARLLSTQGVPSGNRLGVVSNSGASLRMAVDAASGAGLDVVAAVDLGWEASPEVYAEQVDGAVADGADQLLVVFAPPDRRSFAEFFDVLADAAARHPAVPVLASVYGSDDASVVGIGNGSIPLFRFPDEAVAAAGHAAQYGVWRSGAAVEALDSFTFDAPAARAALAVYVSHGHRRLDPVQAAALLAKVDLEVVPFRVVGDAAAAADAAHELGYPVVLKTSAVVGRARRELEGASLDLHDRADVEAAFARMETAFGDDMRRAVVQRMVAPGHDLELGVAVDPHVGPLAWVDDGADIRRTLAPLTAGEVDRLLDVLPDGPRRETAEVLVRVTALVEAVPEIERIVLTPLIVSLVDADAGCAITNVAIDLRPDRIDDRPDVRRL